MGALLLPSERFTRFGNPAWPGVRTANFAAFGSWSEALLKDTESLRDSDALMRVAVPRRRGPAGLRYSVCNLVMLLFFSLCVQYFLNVRGGGGITTLGAFRTFTNIPGPGIRTASFAAFGAWSGVLPKNAESLRNSDALMRVAVPRRRGPAGLRDLFATW